MRGSDGHGADACEADVIADAGPHLAAIHRFPDAAAGGAEVVNGGIAGDARCHGGLAAAKGSDEAPAHTGVEVGVDGLGEGGGGERGEEKDAESGHGGLLRFYLTAETQGRGGRCRRKNRSAVGYTSRDRASRAWFIKQILAYQATRRASPGRIGVGSAAAWGASGLARGSEGGALAALERTKPPDRFAAGVRGWGSGVGGGTSLE